MDTLDDVDKRHTYLDEVDTLDDVDIDDDVDTELDVDTLKGIKHDYLRIFKAVLR